MKFSFIILIAVVVVGARANYQCYQCTSAENEKCATNDDTSLTEFKKPCPPLKEGELSGSTAIGCRKIVQSIESKESIVRECAYSGDNVDGLKKTGNYGIQLYFYQCSNENENSPCNSIAATFTFVPFLLATLFVF